MINSEDKREENTPPKHVPSKEAIEIASRILANRAKREGLLPPPSTEKTTPYEK